MRNNDGVWEKERGRKEEWSASTVKSVHVKPHNSRKEQPRTCTNERIATSISIAIWDSLAIHTFSR